MKRNVLISLVAPSALAMAALAGTVALFSGVASSQIADRCEVKSVQAMTPDDVIATIVSAQMIDKPVRHCRVDGYVTTINPGPGKVNFRLQMPDKSLWKGRYYFVGLGAAAGFVPTDSQIPAGNPMVKGFAVAGTDTGHVAHPADWSFMDDPVKRLDYTHRGAHEAAVVTQRITRAYYGAAKLYRYHSGCSGGGRMGWEALREHPGDFDGILTAEGSVSATRPAGQVMMKFIHVAQQYNREPGAWVSPAKIKMVEDKVTAACDMTDGAKDGVVWDDRLCKFDVASLQCKSGDGPTCLTKPEVKSLKAILAGPRDTRGNLLSYPVPITNLTTGTGFFGEAPPPWSTVPGNTTKGSSGYVMATTQAHGNVRKDYDVLKDFDFNNQAKIDEFVTAFRMAGTNRNMPTSVEPFESQGGKVILWGGMSSPCCSYLDLEEYYKNMSARMGKQRVDNFLRVYLAPGMGHCGGGTGPDDVPDLLLNALVDWVEQGKKPEAIVAHRGRDRAKFAFKAAGAEPAASAGVLIPAAAGASRDFLVCPYPQVSVFDTSKAKVPGAVFEAANWSCRASRR